MGGIKTAALAAVTAVLLSSCSKHRPDARLAVLERAKDSIECAIAGKKEQAKAAEAAGFHYFKKADLMVRGKMRGLTADEKRLVRDMNAIGFGALERADSLKAEIAVGSAHLKQKGAEIEAVKESGDVESLLNSAIFVMSALALCFTVAAGLAIRKILRERPA